ncbi:hypothetical protein MC7420_3299 [Coleofasciculus chthonoplastes PCC 7420]|uniref:Uncharacterized protein n=1 Tax=Coleofasciculus chthonoplastes PCC 7420 TaxID=118168 RepID=B4VZ41_9CYAN|nr:hypothetical protein MC7420_3299 [Coleofasciculus chthonoplastes PCC 7420]
MFQSLIGIQGDLDREANLQGADLQGFQSLIGIQGDLDCRPLKRLLYLVFKVQFRETPLNISFPASADKRYPKTNPFKPSPSNAFSVSENLTLRQNPSNPDETRNTAEKSDSPKKTPTPSRISFQNIDLILFHTKPISVINTSGCGTTILAYLLLAISPI